MTRTTIDIGGSLSGAAKGTFKGKDGEQIVASVEKVSIHYQTWIENQSSPGYKKLSNAFGDLLDEFLDKTDIFGDVPLVGVPIRIAVALTRRAFQVSPHW